MTQRNLRAAVLVYAILLVKQILVWFVLYRVAGYSMTTLTIAQGLTLALGVLFLLVYRLGGSVGIGLRRLIEGMLGVALAYVVLLGILLLARTLDPGLVLFRESYSVPALLNNWILTGLAEELVFAGVLLTLLLRLRTRRIWPLVLVVALLFGLWHLPGAVAVAVSRGGMDAGVLGQVAIPVVSWCLFGSVYLLSGNLWLTAFVHASTDYALLPAIVNRPLFGLVFMVISLGIAWWLGARRPSRAD